MGRHSDYAALHNKIPVELAFDDVKDKFCKAPMSAAELAAYLSGREETKALGLTEKSIRNYVEKICSRSKGTLTVEDFKQDGQYVFPPECHALFLALIDSSCLDGRKNGRRLAVKAERHQQLLQNIDTYLSPEDQAVVHQAASYRNALLERHLTTHIERELAILIHYLFHADEVCRYKQMLDFISVLASVRKRLQSADTKATASRMVYAHTWDDANDAKHQCKMFEAESLESFLIEYLAAKIHDPEKSGSLHEGYTLTPAAVALAAELYGISTQNREFRQMIHRIDRSVKDHERFQDIMRRLVDVLDIEDPIEGELLKSFEQLVYIQFFRPEVSPKDYQNTRRFVESCIKENKLYLLDEFAKLGRNSYSEEELQAIYTAQSGNN